MRILLIAIGSTGDVQPMTVLGKALAGHGHLVTVAAFEALRPLVEAAGLGYHALPGDAERYIGHIIRPGANPLTYLTRLERALHGLIEPLLETLLQACQANDAIITGFFGATFYAFAAHLGKPLIQANYCLTDTTGAHCLPVMRQPPLGRWFNRATYRIAYRMISLVEARYIVPWCAQRGIRPRTMRHGPDYHINAFPVPVLYAFSEHVVTRPADWDSRIRIVGFWEEEDETPSSDAALHAFLRQGEMPVYIGFGSMTSGDMGEALSIVLKALARTGMRAVLSAGWGGLDAATLPPSVHVLRTFVSHRWLFGQVAAVVHHGGAGTTAAALMAGRPTLAVPFGSDQYFWGDRIKALGCGPKPIPRVRLTVKRLAAALDAMAHDASYAENARRIGARMRREDGPDTAAALIEEALRGADKAAGQP